MISADWGSLTEQYLTALSCPVLAPTRRGRRGIGPANAPSGLGPIGIGPTCVVVQRSLGVYSRRFFG